MNTIQQTVLNYWHNAKVKTSPNGWSCRNAVCCEHRGQTPDKRGRGGLKIDGDTIVFHCFNCSYSCSYTSGKPLYPKFIKFLSWLGVDETTISQLKLASLKITETENIVSKTSNSIKSIDLPNSSLLYENPKAYDKHVSYLESRGLSYNDFPFLVSDEIGYRNRIILPFILRDTMIGYSARSIIPTDKNRFIMKQTTDFVFGLDFVKPKYEWVILSEGLFDALSVKGLAVMHNEINENQTNLIHDLHTRIIVVPDLDETGLSNNKTSLIQTAIDNDWDVSFPEWDFKDINKAYVKYGQLFVIKHILNNATKNSTKIKVNQKLMLNRLRADRKEWQ